MFFNRIMTALVVILVSILFGCKNTTSVESGVVHGIAQMDGASDHQGISIKLYNASVVPDIVMSYQNQYPTVGVLPSDIHFFDHRLNSCLYDATTDSEGNFTFNNVKYGSYILVYYKEDWGVKYLFDINVDNADVEVSSRLTPLSPVQTLSQPIAGTVRFQTGKSYLIEDDTTCLPGSEVIFEGGSYIFISEGKRLDVYGNVIIEVNKTNPTIITTADNLYSSATVLVPFQSIQINADAYCPNLSELIVSNSNEGIILHANNTTCNDLVIRDSGFAIQLYNCNQIDLSSCIFYNNCYNMNEAVSIHGTTNCLISNNLYIDNYTSINVAVSSGIEVTDNCFVNGSVQFQNSMQSSSIVTHNTFICTETAIANTGMSNLSVTYNDVTAKICIKTYHSNNMYNNPTNGWTLANNNNLIASSLAVDSKAMYFYLLDSTPMPQNYTNNYWGVTDPSLIDILIYDYNDSPPPHLDSACWAIINYTPYKTSRISNAGIRS